MKKTDIIRMKKVIAAKKEGVSNEKIMKIHSISKSTINKYMRNVSIETEKSKGGRPSILSGVEKSTLIKNFTTSSFTSISVAREFCQNTLKKNISKTSILRILKQNNINCYIKQKKPLISLNNKKKRIDYALKHVNFSYFEWKNIIFSDESKFALNNTNKREFYWSVKRNSLDEKNIKATTKFGGGSIMVWGCISAMGVGKLIRIDGNVNAAKYIDILTHGLIPSLEKLNFTNKEIFFMQDNAPCHTAKSVKTWLNEQKITVIQWPPQSPDLNPIENVWNAIDISLRKKIIKPKDTDELWNYVQDEWNNLSNNFLRSLYMSLTKRTTDVLKQHGGPTKY